VSEDDIKVLRKYLASLAPPKLADSAAIKAAEDQYRRWIKDSGLAAVKEEFNGLAFIPDYKNWRPVSASERWDNGTMRLIMGNPVAVAAINEGHTNPWPDGTAFAKVAWKQLLRPSGEIEPGEFVQVELMVKDKSKYAATDGWGWGRWKGDQLKPYGKDASFVTECMGCHQPMKNNDFTFTLPMDRHVVVQPDPNERRPGSREFHPLDWRAITSRIDKSKGTMSILYGDTDAVVSVRKGSLSDLSVLALVTWTQKEDEHWYGANITSAVQSVEIMGFGLNGEGFVFSHYEGQPLQKKEVDAAYIKERIAYLTGLRASVMP
jgi:hypothetical protein